jgi:hypothetical protein
MIASKKQSSLIAALLMFAFSLAAAAQQPSNGDNSTTRSQVVPLARSGQLVSLLPDSLASLRATGELKQVASENLAELVGDKAQFYREYRVTAAVSREYGRARIDVFETQHQLAAFGLFSFNSGSDQQNAVMEDIGSGGSKLDSELVFFKGRFFVRISDPTRSGRRDFETLARAVAAEITPANTAITRAALLDSLPPNSIAGTQRYFLGPESLNAYVQHARDLFDFNGDTEAVTAEYEQAHAQSSDQKSAPSTSKTTGSLKIAIVEYHTPQFATDAMTRATEYLSSLPENEQQQIIIKRVGNFIVEAADVRDRSFAESLVNSVEYPYAVKWLRNPLWPTNDPFRAQKAAQMLLSTFGLLGLILMTVLGVGIVFGTTIFLKRRKRQQQVFSDAGGMLRLDIDQLETAMLGLPPAREE